MESELVAKKKNTGAMRNIEKERLKLKPYGMKMIW